MSPVPSKPTKPTLSADEIASALANLPPDKLAQIRAKAVAAGLQIASPAGCRKLADGRMEITVTLPAEVTEPLEVWAESAAEPLHGFVEKIIVDATTSYVFGGVLVEDAPVVHAPAVQPAVVPAAPPPAAPAAR